MKRSKKKNRNCSRQSNFRFEALEPRQLLAGDLTSSPVLDLVSASSDTALVTAISTEASRSATVDSGSSIPTTNAETRALDGTGNNLSNPEFGSTGEQLLRIAAADYTDGLSELAGENRVSAREISNALAVQTEGVEGNDRDLSAFIFVWGQFLDHDLGLTTMGSDSADIEVPVGDPQFDPESTGTQTIHFTRSNYDPTTGIDSPREQVNVLTSFIDGSQVYGVDQETSDSLRSFQGGRLLVGEDSLLPIDENGDFIAGDERVNENIELTSMHALFVREHNLWADQIRAENPRMTDEAIFQQARAIVIAEIQAITYNEFLPALLGEGAIGDYSGYDESVNPGLANEFSTAAYRLHTFINEGIGFFGDDGREVRDEVALRDAFFNPDLLRETGVDSILKYVASSQSQEFDTEIVDSLRNFLFGSPGSGGFDLASLNIQRGRDHGLADYNSTRESFGLDRVDSFADITSDVDMQAILAQLYGSVDDIDLWVGLLAEDHVAGSSTGETARAIIIDQFVRVRDGDRLWYQNTFSGQSLAAIDSTSLSNVIQRNTDITNLQANVFFMNAEVTGQVFVDRNGNGEQSRQERGVANVAIELLNDEGEVIETTFSNRNGFYSFTNFQVTGDYQVRMTLPNRTTATTSTTELVLISRGGELVSDVNFGLRANEDGHHGHQGHHGQNDPNRGRDANQRDQLFDIAFSDFDSDDDLDPFGRRRART